MSAKVGVFVDVGNQYYTINKKWSGRKLNYKKYLERAKTFGTITRAFAYGTQVGDAASKFITALHHLGFEPQYKKVEKNIWYSWSVGMAMDIVKLVINNRVDTIVVGNSDRCMTHVLTWAKEKGIQVIIMGCGICRELRKSCDRWIELNETMLEEEETEDEEKDPSTTETTE